MKILLIQPEWSMVYGKYKSAARMGNFYPPLGICYIAAYLKQERPDLQVRVIDAEAEAKPPAEQLDAIKAYAPDFVGITATTPLFKQALQLAVFVIVTAAIYLSVFTHQDQVLRWLVGAGTLPGRLLGVVLVVALVPIVAYAYGTSARLVMRGLSALASARHRGRGQEAGR